MKLFGKLIYLIVTPYFLDSSSQYSKYDDSFEKILSHAYENYLDPFRSITKTMTLEQEIIQTFDGAFARKQADQKALKSRGIEYTSRARYSDDQPFLTIKIKLSNSINRV